MGILTRNPLLQSNHMAEAGRLAAQSLPQAPQGDLAMAHKLARLLWHLLKFREAFHPEVFTKEETKMKRQKLQGLESMARTLHHRIVPIP
jgi:hypothetical protein